MVFNLWDLIKEVWVWVELHWVGVPQIITLRSKWLADVLPIADCLSEIGVTSISISRRIQASPSISSHIQHLQESPSISKYLTKTNIRLLLLKRQHVKLGGNLNSGKIWSLEGVWSEFTVWEEVNLPRWHLSWFSPLCRVIQFASNCTQHTIKSTGSMFNQIDIEFSSEAHYLWNRILFFNICDLFLWHCPCWQNSGLLK